MLRGESPARIGFLKRIMEEAPANLAPIERTPENHMLYWDVSVALSGQDYLLIYLGFNRPLYRELELPAGISYTVDVIDTWGMTIDRLPGIHTGTVKVDLGARQYMAIRLTKAN
ncbi:MAG: DUF5605 domain-containing protein [Propionibacteriaceae bacterium]|nr:DUF5605 domain-containing protein [Propionibacteriaceae bacterium]